MYYYGTNYGYPGGYPYAYSQGTPNGIGMFAIVLVLFILLVIIGSGRNYRQTCGGCGGM